MSLPFSSPRMFLLESIRLFVQVLLTETKLVSQFPCLVLLRLLQLFQCPFRVSEFGESDCKVTASFSFRKIFRSFFSKNFRPPRRLWAFPDLRLQRYALFRYQPNFFATFFKIFLRRYLISYNSASYIIYKYKGTRKAPVWRLFLYSGQLFQRRVSAYHFAFRRY